MWQMMRMEAFFTNFCLFILASGLISYLLIVFHLFICPV